MGTAASREGRCLPCAFLHTATTKARAEGRLNSTEADDLFKNIVGLQHQVAEGAVSGELLAAGAAEETCLTPTDRQRFGQELQDDSALFPMPFSLHCNVHADSPRADEGERESEYDWTKVTSRKETISAMEILPSVTTATSTLDSLSSFDYPSSDEMNVPQMTAARAIFSQEQPCPPHGRRRSPLKPITLAAASPRMRASPRIKSNDTPCKMETENENWTPKSITCVATPASVPLFGGSPYTSPFTSPKKNNTNMAMAAIGIVPHNLINGSPSATRKQL